MEFGEKVNFAIFKAFEEQGIQFSLPLRHSYWKRDDEQGPLDVRLLWADERKNIPSKQQFPPSTGD